MILNSGIYKITHIDSGLFYIGQSINLDKRINNHRWGKSSSTVSYLANAIKKYGWDSFKVEILVYAEEKDYLNLLEEKIISLYNCLKPNGFNLRPGGNSSTPSEESKKKISETRKEKFKDGSLTHPKGMLGKKAFDSTKEKMSKAHLGKKRSQEFKDKMKQIALIRWQNSDYKTKVLSSKGII